ncbi:hypothetical protein LTS09_014786 [Friedmanniomyces endolithicus]|nr:hypothetical protein LTS09_014786 [Friedmanniomyces endolithicus]
MAEIADACGVLTCEADDDDAASRVKSRASSIDMRKYILQQWPSRLAFTTSRCPPTTSHHQVHRSETPQSSPTGHQGYDVGGDFVQRARERTVFHGAKGEDSVCAVDCSDKPARKRRAQAVLEIVQRELGAVPIPGKEIWDVSSTGAMGDCEPKFTTYLYIRGTKCVGFLLTEAISSARRVLQTAQKTRRTESSISTGGALSSLRARKQAAEDAAREAANQPIELSDTSYPAKLGISRIWTSPHHRHHNIATTLLDTAILHHNQRTAHDEEVGPAKTPCSDHTRPSITADSDGLLESSQRLMRKEDVAFSAPTGAGARLARRWFGKLYGWGVYVD